MNAKKDSGRKKTQKSGMGRSALRLLVSLAAGGAAGFGISWAVSSARGGMRETAENLSLAFQESAWIFSDGIFPGADGGFADFSPESGGFTEKGHR